MDDPTGEQIRRYLDREYEGEILLAQGFDPALIGIAEGWFTGNSHRKVALYDFGRCVEVLLQQGLSEEDAEEYMSYNVTGAYVGEGTPVFAVVYRNPNLQPLE